MKVEVPAGKEASTEGGSKASPLTSTVESKHRRKLDEGLVGKAVRAVLKKAGARALEMSRNQVGGRSPRRTPQASPPTSGPPSRATDQGQTHLALWR